MIKFTEQERAIIGFLRGKKQVHWEELAQFCKDPLTVKLKTVQKAVSDIKKKYKDGKLQCPFACSFTHLIAKPIVDKAVERIPFNGQQLVKIAKPEIPVDPRKSCQIDFTPNKYKRQVITKNGAHNLSDDDFEIFEYLYSNPEKIVSLEELRDKVVFPLYGNKLPARWFSSIQRRVNNVRHAVPELKSRILTVKLDNNSSGYMFR